MYGLGAGLRLAKLIIEIAKNAERNPKKLCDDTLN
jgi:hypothetical protein